MSENPLEHMVSSQRVKEIQQGSLNPIQDGSMGGPGSLNDHLRFSLILPFYTRKENGNRGDGALTFIFSSIKHALRNDVMFLNEQSSLSSFQRGTTNSLNCCKSFDKIELYRLCMMLLNLLLM